MACRCIAHIVQEDAVRTFRGGAAPLMSQHTRPLDLAKSYYAHLPLHSSLLTHKIP